jgi:Flp pilus assembly protein TadG
VNLRSALRRLRRDERGDTFVFLAFALPVLILIVAFVLDIGNWLDHRRHLQLQADAAAFAGGSLFQQCTGDQTAANTAIQTATQTYGGDPIIAGSLNRQIGGSNAGTVIFDYNSKTYSVAGGPPADDTATGGACTAKMVDAKLTEHGLKVFFGLLPFSQLNVRSHARTEVQGVGEEGDIRPIAVRDAKVTPCVSARFINETSGSQIGSDVVLTKQPEVVGQPTTWQNSTAAPVQMASGHVAVQLYLNNCNGTGDVYDPKDIGNDTSGLLFINTFDSTPASGTDPPKIVGPVTLTSSCDPYFSFTYTVTCTVDVHAVISATVNNSKLQLTAVDLEGGNSRNMNVQGNGSTWNTQQSFPIDPQSGPHNIKIDWKQSAGTVGAQICGNGTNNQPPPCEGTFGVQQRTFSGFDDSSSPPEDSGPIVSAQVSNSGPGLTGPNSFDKTGNPGLYVTVKIAGLENAPLDPNFPATILRFGTTTNKQTGLVDCGQGNGANADYDGILYGCPNPVQVNTRNGVCDPPNSPVDCVSTIQGNRRNKIPEAIADRVNCSDNNWDAYASGAISEIPADDPRKVILIVTAPADLSGQTGPTLIPIRTFATFYVTGWDTTGNAATCNKNDPFPIKGKKNNQNGAIWGYYIKNFIPSGSGSGTGAFCDFNAFGNCISVLTR